MQHARARRSCGGVARRPRRRTAARRARAARSGSSTTVTPGAAIGLAERVEQERRAPVERRAGDRAGEVAQQRRRDLGIEDDGHSQVGTRRAPSRRSVRRAASRPIASAGARARRACRLRRVPVVALHAAVARSRPARRDRLKLRARGTPPRSRGSTRRRPCPPPQPNSAPSELVISGDAASAALSAVARPRDRASAGSSGSTAGS